MASMEYLGRIGYQRGRIVQGILIHSLCSEDMENKKVILLGAGKNSFYAEMLLKERGIIYMLMQIMHLNFKELL